MPKLPAEVCLIIADYVPITLTRAEVQLPFNMYGSVLFGSEDVAREFAELWAVLPRSENENPVCTITTEHIFSCPVAAFVNAWNQLTRRTTVASSVCVSEALYYSCHTRRGTAYDALLRFSCFANYTSPRSDTTQYGYCYVGPHPRERSTTFVSSSGKEVGITWSSGLRPLVAWCSQPSQRKITEDLPGTENVCALTGFVHPPQPFLTGSRHPYICSCPLGGVRHIPPNVDDWENDRVLGKLVVAADEIVRLLLQRRPGRRVFTSSVLSGKHTTDARKRASIMCFFNNFANAHLYSTLWKWAFTTKISSHTENVNERDSAGASYVFQSAVQAVATVQLLISGMKMGGAPEEDDDSDRIELVSPRNLPDCFSTTRGAAREGGCCPCVPGSSILGGHEDCQDIPTEQRVCRTSTGEIKVAVPFGMWSEFVPQTRRSVSLPPVPQPSPSPLNVVERANDGILWRDAATRHITELREASLASNWGHFSDSEDQRLQDLDDEDRLHQLYDLQDLGHENRLGVSYRGR